VVLNGAMPGYFRTMSTKLVAGRDFDMNEGNSAEPSVIVNEAFARQAGLGASIAGRKIIAPWASRPYTVLGVVATARMAGPEYDGSPQAYWPVREEPPPSLTFVAKVRGDSSKYLAICRDAVAGLDRNVPVYEVKTLDRRLRETLGRPQFYTISILFLGCLALLLALVGVYGSASRAIIQREHELGVRMVLGASTSSVRTMMVRQSLKPIGVGLVAGIAGAIGLGPIVQHLFVGATTPGIPSCIAASILLLAAAFTATWGATTRILAIDPVDAIRAE
jgi:hypothetical protein